MRGINLQVSHLEFLFLMMLVTIYLVWFAWPIVWTASENVRLVSVFSTDEAMHIHLLREALDKDTLRFEWKFYGHLYFYGALLPLYFLNHFIRVSDRQIIIVLRLVSTISAIATAGATFLFVRRYFGRIAGWLTTYFLVTVSLDFLRFSVMSHPDTTQLFFLMLAMYFCCLLAEEQHTKWLILASTFAGLAFSTKYSGIFLLPIIWGVVIIQTIKTDNTQIKINTTQIAKNARYVSLLIGVIAIIIWIITRPDLVAYYLSVDGSIDDELYLRILNLIRLIAIFIGCVSILLSAFPSFWSKLEQSPKLVQGLYQVIISFATFGIAFFLTSPFSLIKLSFVLGMIYDSSHVGFGHHFEESKNGLLWFPVLSSPPVLDRLIFGIAVVSLVWAMYKTIKSGYKGMLNPEFIISVWIIFYLSYLILRVDLRWGHYLLPIIPFLIILVALLISQAIDFVTNKFAGKGVVLAVVIPFIVSGVVLFRSFGGVLEFRQTAINRESISSSVLAGHWLAEHYSVFTRILYDYQSYVPPSFHSVYATWGGTPELLDTIEPDLVFVDKNISQRFSDIHQAKKFDKGEQEFMRRYKYYEALREGKVNYALIRDFGDVQIYARVVN